MKKFILLVICLVFISGTAYASNYTLEITRPTAALSSNDRSKRAYTGITYSYVVAAIGGTYPFTYSLANVPSGMTIDSSTGIITWLNPTSTATGIQVTVTDADSNTDTETWTITVGTSGFYFVDASVAPGGTGTLADPFKTIEDVWSHTTTTAIVYFKNGTYDQTGLTVASQNTYGAFVDWGTQDRSAIWIAYPGHSPIIDMAAGVGTFPAAIQLTQSDCYVDGITFNNIGHMAFRNVHGVFVRNAFNNAGPGVAESNPGTIWMSDLGTNHVGGAVLRNTFTTSDGDEVSIQSYAEDKFLIADNTFTNVVEAIAIKGDHERWEIRGNTFTILAGAYPNAINGNMYTANNGEIRYNNIKSGQIILNYTSATISAIYLTRNTFNGRIFVVAETGSGPYYFVNNVIINTDGGNTVPYISFQNETDASVIVMTNNLTGVVGDNIIDANGNLLGSYRTLYLGTKGYELGTTPPSAQGCTGSFAGQGLQ